MLGLRRETYRSLMGNPNYRRWFTSSLGSSLGDWIGLFALQVLIISLAEPGTRAALFGLGGLMAARLLPSVVFGPISGVLADRYDRRLLMWGCDLGRAALFLGIAFTRNVLLLIVLVFVVESLSMLYLTTKMTVLPSIVERSQLPEANQIGLGVAFAPLPFGAAAGAGLSWLAGVLEQLGVGHVQPTTAALLFNAVTFLVAGAIIWRLKLDRTAATDEQEPELGAMARLAEGWQVIRQQRLLRGLMAAVVGAFFGVGVILTLGPELVRTELGRASEDWFGAVAAVGFGALVGFLAAPGLGRRAGKAKVLRIVLFVVAVLTFAPALAQSFRWLQVFGFLLGGAAALGAVIAFTLLQEHTPDAVRGRTFGLFLTATRVALFASLALAPFAAGAIGVLDWQVAGRDVEVSGVRLAILAGGMAALASAVTGAWGLRRQRSERPS